MDKAREIALKVLKAVNEDGKYSNIALKEALRHDALDNKDHAFSAQIVYGTLEKQVTIDYILEQFINKRLKNPWVVNILRMGCYQILYLDKVPDFAACSESVNLCRRYAKGLSGLVNGVLRNISRNKEKIDIEKYKNNEGLYLSLKYSYPKWLVDRWLKQYGFNDTEYILDIQVPHNYTTVRVNTLKTSKEQLILSFNSEGIEVKDGFYIPESLMLKGMEDVEQNPFYNQGLFTVQGESSMLVSRILDLKPMDRVLDACSAPGGKAAHMAAIMENKGNITAWDIHPHRVQLIGENMKRLGVSIVEAKVQDAMEPVLELSETMDKVLVDAPCSGLGVVHKKPDIKLRLRPEDLDSLPRIQLDILSRCSTYVKPGGVLLYSTCTINKDENESVIDKFLEEHQEFKLDEIDTISEELKESIFNRGMLRTLPGRDGIDGFFICRLRRSE